MTRGRTPHMILTAYLTIYAAAIAGAVLVTHNMASAAVHLVLLTAGALTLRVILPSRSDTRS